MRGGVCTGLLNLFNPNSHPCVVLAEKQLNLCL
jgi:hypothetical protein